MRRFEKFEKTVFVSLTDDEYLYGELVLLAVRLEQEVTKKYPRLELTGQWETVKEKRGLIFYFK